MFAGVYADAMAASDAELLRRARRDPDALGELYLRHRAAMYAWFRGRVAESAASELTAELFAQVALHAARFRDEVDGSAAPWLYGIAKNLVRRYYEQGRVEETARRRLGMPLQSYEHDFEDVEERVSAGALRGDLASALGTLSADQRRALELRVVDELSYPEVAAMLGCSEVAARIRVMRALRRLADVLRPSKRGAVSPSATSEP